LGVVLTTTESAAGQKVITGPDKPVLAGSVFVNNTSYSGADIKVLVNIYDSGDSIKDQIKLIEDDINRSNDMVDLLSVSIAEARETIEQRKEGTPEVTKAKRTLSRGIREREEYMKGIPALTTESNRLRSSLPLSGTKVLAEAQTISISSWRGKTPVRSFGSVYPKAFVRGNRMIAGSMIFTVFDEHVLFRFLEAHASDFDSFAFTSAVLDQLPPVDISIIFANEYGSISRMALYGVEFVSEGQVMSIEDILTENTVQWVARDWDPMRFVKDRKLDENSRLISTFNSKKASDLIAEEDYQDVKTALDPFERIHRRNTPWT